MPFMDAIKVEVRDIVTAGTWTDITTYVVQSQPITIQYGRSTPGTQPQSAKMTGLTLDNIDGRFTPFRSVLADGSTSHPYYPRLVPRLPIRFSVSYSSTYYQLFQGVVKGWSPAMQDGRLPRVLLDCVDGSEQLSRVIMRADIAAEILADSPIAYWPLNEAAGSTVAADASGVNTLGLTDVGSGTAVTFGNDGPGVEQGLAAGLAGSAKTLASFGGLNLDLSSDAFSVEVWVNFSTMTDTCEPIFSMMDVFGTERMLVTGTGIPTSGSLQWIEVNSGTSSGLAADTSAENGGNWHQVVITQATHSSAPKLYVDGGLVSSGSATGFNLLGNIVKVRIGNATNVLLSASASNVYQGFAAQVAIYDSVLSATRVLQHYQVAQQSSETVTDKIIRYLGYAAISSLTTGGGLSDVVTGTYAQDGKSVFDACQELAGDTEGGGSVFYFDPAGAALFTTRAWRSTRSYSAGTTPVVDANADMDGTSYQPAYDDATQINRVTGTRATASGTASTQIAQNAASITAIGPLDLDFTSYAADDSDVLANAQDQLAQNLTPAFRFGQLTVDITTATSVNVGNLLGVLIGDRIRVTNLYAAAAPVSQVDVYTEGWTHTFSDGGHTVTFDTSPADNPLRRQYTTTADDRYAPGSDANINPSINAGTTSVSIYSNTPWTTVSGRYPMTIKVDEEHISLNAAPTGSSPQVFSSITRGVDGTVAVSHGATTRVYLVPAGKFTL